MVTAETAVVLPFLVLVCVVLVWIVSLGITQVRLVDAAREAARMSARGDDPAKVRTATREMLPDDARITIDVSGGATVVTVRVRRRPQWPLLEELPPVQLDARSVSATEGTSAADGAP